MDTIKYNNDITHCENQAIRLNAISLSYLRDYNLPDYGYPYHLYSYIRINGGKLTIPEGITIYMKDGLIKL